MALVAKPEDSGDEMTVVLPSDSEARSHGRLTARLLQVVDRPAGEVGSLAQVLDDLGEELERDYGVATTEAAAQRPFLAHSALHAALTAIRNLEQRPLRAALDTVETITTSRQEQGDAWPEGRLTSGILYAELGDYEQAERRLDEAVRVLKGGSLLGGEGMAMRA